MCYTARVGGLMCYTARVGRADELNTGKSELD